jgi:hypothetical protein
LAKKPIYGVKAEQKFSDGGAMMMADGGSITIEEFLNRMKAR